MFLHTSHIRLGDQVDRLPQLLYGQAVPWSQRMEVLSPIIINVLDY